MAKYVLKCDIIGGGAKGSLIELTDEQAQHPLYSDRITPTTVVDADEPEAKVVVPPKKN